MKIAEPSIKVLAYSRFVADPEDGPYTYTPSTDPCSELSRIVERCGRISWKSEDKIVPGSADGFITRVVNIAKDESIAEHASVTMIGVTDRYTSHQLVRHRIAAYTQESTHYINYGKRGTHIEVMEPLGIPRQVAGPCSVCSAGDIKMDHHTHRYWPINPAYQLWYDACLHAEQSYFNLLSMGVHHKNARFVLPSCLKTEIAFTFNLRTWRHVLGLRTTPNNTLEIQHLMKLAGYEMAKLCPEMFADYGPK
jgi:thymidylate synthase (FAD)